MDTHTRILGIDPGTRHVGYGVVDCRGGDIVWVAGGCITATGASIAERLVTIYRGLRQVILLHEPASAAVETVFTGANPKTAIAIGEGRGVAVLSAAEQGLAVTGYEPALVKRAVAGSGRADKDQVRQMVRMLLSLSRPPETDHESDALAIAITHARHSLSPMAGGCSGRKAALPGAGRRTLPDFVLKQLPPGLVP